MWSPLRRSRRRIDRKEERMNVIKKLSVVTAMLATVGWTGSAAADASAGRDKFAATCAECHEAADFAGEDPKALADAIGRIVSGVTKHKRALRLTEAEIADVAAYMAAGR
jgi:mono/diheme cytochrome c family protein